MAPSAPVFLATRSATTAAMTLPNELPRFRLDHATAGSAVRTGDRVSVVWTVVVGVAIFAEKATRAGVAASRVAAATPAVEAVAAWTS